MHSRFSVRDFCANQGFAPSTFYYWKKWLGCLFQPPNITT
ncbi:IS66 family insertion sequence element accessory protein TnpA [Geofilum rhodophaeum]